MNDFEEEGDTTQVLVLDGSGSSPRPSSAARDRCTVVLLAGPTTGTIYTLEDDELVFGRGAEATGRVQDQGLSRRHARLFRRDRNYWLEDLGSTNGTFVNGEQLRAPRALVEGDRIQMGANVLLRFHLHDAVEQEATRRLYESAVRDPLTHTYNRRYLDERLEAEVAYARRHGTPLTVLLLDLDHFKRINDTLGHLAGDAVLRVVSGAMMRILRAEDVIARYGGEEFCVIARGIDVRNGQIVGERIRRTVSNLAIPWEGENIKVTLSIGLATLSPETDYKTVASMLAAADAALYRAKEAGRDRVSVA